MTTKPLDMTLRSAARKAYRSAVRSQVDALLAERSRWTRKQTIARNKLAEVDARLARLALRMADHIAGPLPEPEKPTE